MIAAPLHQKERRKKKKRERKEKVPEANPTVMNVAEDMLSLRTSFKIDHLKLKKKKALLFLLRRFC